MFSISRASRAYARSISGSRPKLKDLKPFIGDSIKEVYEFIRYLKIIFVNSTIDYRSDRKKVLYSVM